VEESKNSNGERGKNGHGYAAPNVNTKVRVWGGVPDLITPIKFDIER